MFINIDSDNKVTGKSTIKIGDGIEIADDITVNIGDTYIDGTIAPDATAPIKAQIIEIDMQIEAIEAKSYRPLREIALGLDLDGTALTKLTEYNTQITNLRTQRATLTA